MKLLALPIKLPQQGQQVEIANLSLPLLLFYGRDIAIINILNHTAAE